MGSIHTAYCKCGFEERVTVGGGMSDFQKESFFPFFCVDCGLISVNIALKKNQNKPCCPKCGAKKIHQYGKSPASVLEIHDESDTPALQWSQYQANPHGNICPACKRMTLVFARMPSILFD